MIMKQKKYTQFKEFVQHGNSMLPFEIYYCNIPSNFSFYPMHYHEELEIIYIKNGIGKICVDLTPLIVTEGNIVIIGPNTLHSISQYDSECMEYDTLLFNINMLDVFNDSSHKKYFKPILNNEIIPLSVINKNMSCYSNMNSSIENIANIYSTKPLGFELKIKSELLNIFFHLFNDNLFSLKGNINKLSENTDKIKIIMDYIDDYYMNSISIKELSTLCNFSESHFMKFFKESTGLSCIQYLNNYRLNIAATMLFSTNKTITDIAVLSGFDNISYFNRAFKRKYMLTPKEYRQKI